MLTLEMKGDSENHMKIIFRTYSERLFYKARFLQECILISLSKYSPMKATIGTIFG